MEKKFIKMNNNDNYLSLGNLVNLIKKYSKKKESSIQQEVFCSIFNIDNINNTTVNNYLIGYRAVGLEYKKIYVDLKNKYINDNNVFFKIFSNILSILEEKIFVKDDMTLEFINNNNRLNLVCKDLVNLGYEDNNVSMNFKNKIKDFYNNNNLYECFIECLFYAILENKQPIFMQDVDKNFRHHELDEYLKINLYEGISYITSLIELGKKDNMYANAELGSLEYSGIINGKPDFERSYEYYLKAAKKDHPKACWMVANLILMKRVKEKSIDVMWEYLLKSEKLGSIAALNTLGKCYMSEYNPENKIDVDKALYYFNKAGEHGYSYAYNNLGVYYENIDLSKALEYYKLSADLYNSWALNKVGEILRNNGNIEDAYFYYLKSIEAPFTERYYYSYYNLAKYYYLVGNKELGIEVDIEKSLEYLKIANENGVSEAAYLLNQIEKNERVI